MKVRRNVLFNRFFAVHDGWGTKKFEKFYPFTDQQKATIIGFDVPHHYKMLKKELADLEKRVTNLKAVICMGQKGIKDFDRG